MGGGFPIDLILFAALALFLIFRLGSVLGKRTGHQKPSDIFGAGGNGPGDKQGSRDRAGEREDAPDENVIRMPGARQTDAEESPEFSGPAGSGLTQIKVADGSFDPDQFLDGARQAFEMIVRAYAEGEGKTLKQLLSKDVYESFAAAIREREKAGERMEDILYGIDSAEIVAAGMQGATASVTVKFVSQQINVTYDSEGRVIAGDPNGVITVTDIWTFQRNVKARDPNWELVETTSPEEDAGAQDDGDSGNDGESGNDGGSGNDGDAGDTSGDPR